MKETIKDTIKDTIKVTITVTIKDIIILIGGSLNDRVFFILFSSFKYSICFISIAT